MLVHPWPESDDLHRHVAADAAVDRVAEHVDHTVHRPFAVAVYRRRANPGTGDAAAALTAGR